MSYRLRSPRTRKGLWKLSSAAGVLTPDDSGFGNNGTLVNDPTWAETPWGPQCIELDGVDQYVNLGDLTYLNSVSQFTIAFWMNQDVLDQSDIFFQKHLDGNNEIRISTSVVDGDFYFINDALGAKYGQFDYSTIISAHSWHHVAMVFDGNQTGNANRLIVYVDAAPVTLAFTGTIGATTANLTGVDAEIGAAVDSLDGKLFDLGVYSCSLSRDEISDLMLGHD